VCFAGGSTIPATPKVDKNIAADPVKINRPGKGSRTLEIFAKGRVDIIGLLIFQSGWSRWT
jgi:hypothetical protein